MASPNLTTETSGRLQLPLVQDLSKFNSDFVQFEDGRTQAWKTNDTELQGWELSYSGQTNSEFAALRAFYVARQGAYGLFYWNNPISGEVDIPVRFVPGGDGFSWAFDGPGTRAVKFRIRRVTL